MCGMESYEFTLINIYAVKKCNKNYFDCSFFFLPCVECNWRMLMCWRVVLAFIDSVESFQFVKILLLFGYINRNTSSSGSTFHTEITRKYCCCTKMMTKGANILFCLDSKQWAHSSFSQPLSIALSLYRFLVLALAVFEKQTTVAIKYECEKWSCVCVLFLLRLVLFYFV